MEINQKEFEQIQQQLQDAQLKVAALTERKNALELEIEKKETDLVTRFGVDYKERAVKAEAIVTEYLEQLNKQVV